MVQAKDDAGKQAVDDAGAPILAATGKYGLHALRHACASLWIESGYNPKQIQRLMGTARSK
jgi:integrase